MSQLITAVTGTPASVDLPLWIELLLAGGTITAVLQYVSKRAETKAGQRTTEAIASFTDVSTLNAIITGVTAENVRLRSRLVTMSDELQEEIDRRPTRDELVDRVQTLRQQLRGLGETPINGPKGVT